MIVIEGFDPWKILAPGNPKKNFSFEDLISKDFNGKGLNVLINYTHGSNYYATLSDALQGELYDLIFVDFDNGADYIQRNAYLVENIIAWVNSVKEPYNGVMQKNIVMGASMGGLVARYALRDMELSNPVINHDTKLYVSFDTPHQGANFPVGFQAMVSHLNGVGIGIGLPGILYYPPWLQFGNIKPQLGRSFKLLNSPAARQMLYYSVVGTGNLIFSDPSIHDAFMTDYKQKGYPQLGGIRNLVIANGSECGTDQGYPPYSEFANDHSNTRLNFWENLLGNVLSPFALLTNYPQASAGGLLTTRTDIKTEFIINALPNQTGQRVYKGKMYVKKKILFLIDATTTIFDKSFSALPSFLPIDNSGGGVRDLAELAEDLPFTLKRTRFSFVPTFSALDIGGGTQPITYTEVTRSYSAAFPPSFPKNVVAANFFANPSEAGSSNEIHTQVTLRNGRWLFQEITGTPAFFTCSYSCIGATISPNITGPSFVCTTGSSFNLNNAGPGTTITWQAAPASLFTSSSGTGTVASLQTTTNASGDFATITFTIQGSCGSLPITKDIWVGSPDQAHNYPLYVPGFYGENPITLAPQGLYTFQMTPVPGAISYDWILPSGFSFMSGQPTTESTILIWTPQQSGSYVLECHPIGGCGISGTGYQSLYINIGECPDPPCQTPQPNIVYPNPADQSFSVSGFGSESAEIKLYNNKQELVYSAKVKGEVFSIPVNNLPHGNYYLHVINKEGVTSRQVIVRH